MGNGNSGGINLGIVGADWGPDGGGATIMGIRLGGSGGRGFEVGLNPGIGVQVNGEGLYAGARADVGIRDGINVNAGARATAGKHEAGAMAEAHAHASGCDSSSTSATAASLREVERVLEMKNKAVRAAEKAVSVASEKLDELSCKVAKADKNVKAKTDAMTELQSQVQEKSNQLTNLQNLRHETEPALHRQQLEVGKWCVRMERALQRPEKSSKALALQTSIKTGQQAIALMEFEIGKLNTEIAEKEDLMLKLKKELTEESIELKDLQSKLDKAKAEKQGCSEKLKTAKLDVKKAVSDVERVRKEYDDADKRLRLVRGAA